ncbi:cyclic-phosphate processing receiver domain-containing protein [Peribacillus kribbensis]|uniref:cyclic-phosphate processing receiver domain-containing protein n=1 Tax=Peribacillus kribbensis TaxID=356658 RepID=UPI00047CCB1C|nr:cyclic-phosphate processing receiver domain-containing protein [Peribacillus kribbensis]
METISIFLDDYRKAPDGYVLAETIDECVELLKNFDIKHLSLDHDLLNKTRNGFMLVQKMIKEKLFAKHITIHSANSVGGKAMYNCLKQAQRESIMPPSIIVSLRPLPLNFFPPKVLQHYLEIR